MQNRMRRRRRQLSPEEKWELFLEVTSGQLTQADAARKWGVDVSGCEMLAGARMRVCAPSRFGAPDVAGRLRLTRRATASVVAPRARHCSRSGAPPASLLAVAKPWQSKELDQGRSRVTCVWRRG